MGGFIPLPVEISFICRIPVGIARSVPGGFIGGFAMKNACAIVLQVKEFFYRLEQFSTPLGIA